MEFTLRPVDSIPEYIDVYCGFNGDHKHLPIIWRNTYRSSYTGWADWDKKYGMVNFYHLHNFFIDIKDIHKFVDEFLRIYYHEFIHLFFKFRANGVYFKGKIRKLHHSEKVVDRLAIALFISEIVHVNNWAYEIFEDELNEV